MTKNITIAELVGPAIAKYSSQDQRIFAALAERIAASRYRAWAEAIGDEDQRSTLLRCAGREEEIAQRVESLQPDAAAMQEQMPKDNPQLQHQYLGLFDGLALPDQFALQAEAELAGAAAWRAFADACSNPGEAEKLRSCAPLEEASAADLKQIIASMTTEP
ncbi:MAG: hypothetical protein IH973_05655 [Myxococcales bacterium]|nr:hypothetical protein [Myxococcales bacterium]